MPGHRLVQEMAERVRQVADDPDAAGRLRRAVTAAVDLVDGCSCATITLVAGQRATTGTASDEVGERADRLQHELGEGPSLDALRGSTTVVGDDLAVDLRWPSWAPAAHRWGIGAAASFRLSGHGRTSGVLTLYGQHGGALDEEDLAVGGALATHLGAVLALHHEIHHLGVALDSRTVIGQAQGLAMERHGLSADAAFALLRQLSQHDNRKLISIATELASTRRVPGPPGRPRDEAVGRS